jgi:DNA-directed RNA polymerase subunit K
MEFPDRGVSCVVNMKYTRFEKARIIGSRALQISYGAPVLVDYPESMIDPIDIAMLEYDNDMIPITVVRD